jgi:hypothetical protein
MLSVVLFHGHYDKDHLETVKSNMIKLGTPDIRGFYDEANGVWIAFEGCHRIRAAKELSIIPNMIAVEYDSNIEIQMDDELQMITVSDLLDDVNYSSAIIIDFED